MRIAWATPDRAGRARQGQAADYQPDQVVDCLPGLVEDYPQAPVVDFPQGQEAAYLRALVVGSLRDLEGECLPAQEAGFPPGQAVVYLQDLAAASQQGPATTGDEFRRNSRMAPDRLRVWKERPLLADLRHGNPCRIGLNRPCGLLRN